nr:phage BR0599 family protein [Erythrobacter sp. THAF29]
MARALNEEERAEFAYHWRFFARETQLPPPGTWHTWLIMAGRGFGKTRAGAEWVRSMAEENPHARIALISSSMAEARAVMVEGESGIIACCPPDRAPKFEASLRRLSFPNGAQAHLFSAAEPEALRGPQHSHACRAIFCGPGCGLSARKFEALDTLTAVDIDANRVQLANSAGLDFVDGRVRFLDGTQTGLVFHVVGVDRSWLVLDRSLVEGTPIGTKVEVREGCDHTFQTCRTRFANAVNFRGEPFLPGNDLLARYGKGSE